MCFVKGLANYINMSLTLLVLLVVIISFSEAISKPGNKNLFVMHFPFGSLNLGTKPDKSLGGKGFLALKRLETNNHQHP